MKKNRNLTENIKNSAIYDIVKYFALPIIALLVIKFRGLITKLLTYEIQIWMALLFISFLCLVLYGFQKLKTKHNFIKYGLKWVAEIKKRKVVKIQGPFCMNCGYQLYDSDISENNQCPICSKKYPEIKTTIKQFKTKVSSIVESNLHVGNVLNIDWFIFFFPNSKLSIINNGSFIVKNIKVDISMNVNGKTYHIETYSIDNIPSDETKKIDDSDPMNKVNQIFNNLKLIESKKEVFEDFTEDERGNATFFDREIEWNELMTEFSSTLNISMTYSLRKKIKSTKAKYLLKFKYLYTPPEYPDFIDNFEVSLTEIE